MNRPRLETSGLGALELCVLLFFSKIPEAKGMKSPRMPGIGSNHPPISKPWAAFLVEITPS